MNRNLRLATRITLSFLFATLIPLILISVVFAWALNDINAQGIQTRQASILQVGKAYIGRYFNDIFEEIHLIGGFVQTTNTAWVATIETICTRSSDAYTDLSVINLDGMELARLENCQAQPRSTLRNRSSEEAFFRARRGEKFVGNVSFNQRGQPITTISLLTTDKDGREVVLIARIDLGNIWQPLNLLDVGEGGYLFVVDQRGNLVGYRDQAVIQQERNLATLPSVAPLLANNPGVNAARYSGLTGEDVIGTSSKIEQVNWGLALEQPVNLVYATQTALFNTLIIGLILVVASVIVIALLISRSITTPIQQLAEGALAVGQGDLNTVVSVTSRDEIGVTAQAFNQMTGQLREILSGLEERIRERTLDLQESSLHAEYRATQLATISEIANIVATITDADELLATIARVVSERFGYYHVGIFLPDENGEYAVLRAANSAGGQVMIQREHKLKIEASSSLVGYAASQGEARIAVDVGADAVFFTNPDLPNTHSEIALPLKVGNKVIGVLDAQSEQPNAFPEEDIEILGILANQVGIAIQNTRLLNDARQALNTSEQTYQRYVSRGWQRVTSRGAQIGYRLVEKKAAPIAQALKSAEIRAAIQKGEVVIVSEKKGMPSVTVPIKLRNQVIGVLNVTSQKAGRTWNENELALISAIAERAALALENARLLADAQRRAAKERLIGNISSKLATATSIENILETAARELGQAVRNMDVTVQFNVAEEGEQA